MAALSLSASYAREKGPGSQKMARKQSRRFMSAGERASDLQCVLAGNVRHP